MYNFITPTWRSQSPKFTESNKINWNKATYILRLVGELVKNWGFYIIGLCISWSHDQLSVNTKTVRFWKILLARAELRAYYNKVIFKFSESQKKWLQWLPKIRLDLYEKNIFCHLVMLELFSIQILVNFEIFKLLWNSSLSIMGLKSPFNS